MALVIYHGGCRDGFCAAWAVYRHFHTVGDICGFHAGYYGQPPPDCTDLDVIIVDFSYSREDMERIAATARTLIVLDHHKTAREALGSLVVPRGDVVFDMNRSGAGLAWDYFIPAPRPWVVDYIEDRDLWRHALPDSKAINAYLSVLPFEFDEWTKAAESVKPEEAAALGAIVVKKTDQYVREVLKNARRVTFEGHAVPIVNARQVDISELLDQLAQGEPFAMGWWQRADGEYQYSFRSRGEFDVSELAKKYGGGGHKNAAGFESKELLKL